MKMEYLIRGKLFKTKAEVAEACDVSLNSFNRRIRLHKESIIEAYDYYTNTVDKGPWKLNGITFYDKKDAIEYVGISKWSIAKYMKANGVSFVDACKHYMKQKDSYTFDGITFKSVGEIAKHLGINRNTFYKHMKVYEATVDETYNFYKNK